MGSSSPPTKKSGRKLADRRRILNALLHFLRAGCARRLLPQDCDPWQTVHHYFPVWSADGT